MRVAAVDIGTNTVRLLIARRPGTDAELSPLRRVSTVTRLGAGVDSARRLDPAAAARSLAVLERYRGIIERAGAGVVDAVATSAVRDATDRDDFLDRARGALGVRPRLIAGEEEARLSFRGVLSGFAGPRPVLVIDPGGGSTEFVMGDAAPVFAASIDTGSVRLSERRLPARPAAAEDLEAAAAEVDALLAEIRLPRRPGSVVGVGGTFTALAAILLELPAYDPEAVHRSSFPAGAFVGAVDRLAALTYEETAAIPSLDPDRAPVLLGGAVVAARALVHVGCETVLVSEADILDGVALEAGGA